MKKRKRRNKTWLILLASSTAVFLMSAAVLISGYTADDGEKSEFEILAERVKTAQQDTALVNAAEPALPDPDEITSGDEPVPSGEPGHEILDQYAGLYQENPDLGGWIRIDGTNVNYPVMFTPDDPEKYLHLSFEGKYSKRGVPFIGEGCAITPRSQNIILYGHHMKNGSMFAAIVNYKDIDFWRGHPAIYFSTLYEEGEYEVIAAFETDVYAAEELRCYSFLGAKDEADFNEYIAAIREAALYDTGVDVAYGDGLLTVSTCSYHTSNGRFVVVARKTTS